MRYFSLLCPSRGRAKRIIEFADSVFNTADKLQRIELLIYVDTDDSERSSYYKSLESLRQKYDMHKSIRIFEGPSLGVPGSVNFLAQEAKGEVLLYTSDDQVYIDPGWDIRLDQEVAKYPDEIYCMWFNDAWESQKFCTFPIVSKKWIKELGYFMFPFFEHFFIDTWVWMLAKSVDRAIYISDILVEHRHWKTGKAVKDETYNRNITTATNSKHARDRETMDKFERYFVADVGLLEGLIANKEN